MSLKIDVTFANFAVLFLNFDKLKFGEAAKVQTISDSCRLFEYQIIQKLKI